MSETPYAFFHPRVVRTQRLSPGMLRVVLGGEELAAVVNGGRDQRFKLFLPHPGQDAPVLPDVLDAEWYPRWRGLDPAVRGVMRTYTIRGTRHDPPEIDVDFALHGDTGPASRWARRTVPGDRVALLAPVVEDNGGVDFRPPEGTDWVLITGDETALPAVASILEWLPDGLPAKVWLQVGHPDDRTPLPTKADADVTWLLRPASPVDAVRAADLPAGTPYAWIAGEASGVRALRRHLVGERGIDRKSVTFTGYWRRGTTEDDLLEAAAAEADSEETVGTAAPADVKGTVRA